MRKILFTILGLITFSLGTLGIFLPLVPTTGFYILTAIFWLHGSEKWHQRFINSKFYQKHVVAKFIKRQITITYQIKLFSIMFLIFLIPCLLINTSLIWFILMGIYALHLIGLTIYFNFDKFKKLWGAYFYD